MQRLNSGPKGPKGNKGKGQPQGPGKAKANEKNTAKPKPQPKPTGKGKGKQRDIYEDNDKEFDLDEEEDDMEEDDDMDDMDMDDIDDMEVGDLFWKMEVTKDGEHTVEPPDYFDGLVCITQASFGEEVNNNSRTVVCCTTPYSSEPTPVCVLTAGSHETQALNLKFGSVAQVSLKGRNPSTVYLSGYLQPESEDLDFPEDDDDMDIPEEFSARSKFRQETDDMEPASKKRKIEIGNTKKAIETKKPQQQAKQTAPKTQPAASNKSDESPQTAPGQPGQLTKTQKKKLKKQQKQQQQSDASNGNQDDNKENNTNTNEKPKEDEKQSNETATTTTITTTSITVKTNDTEQTADTKEEEKPKKQPQTPAEKTLPNGITIKDIKVGTGPDIKPGQLLHIFYAGQLEDKTVFDKNLTGSGFPYKFGSEDGIKGWHLGMKGMKPGGKRRIVVPPKFAYGAEGSSEKKVPANQTLTYTIEVLEKTNQ